MTHYVFIFLTVNFVKVKLFVALVERRHAEPFC